MYLSLLLPSTLVSQEKSQQKEKISAKIESLKEKIPSLSMAIKAWKLQLEDDRAFQQFNWKADMVEAWIGMTCEGQKKCWWVPLIGSGMFSLPMGREILPPHQILRFLDIITLTFMCLCVHTHTSENMLMADCRPEFQKTHFWEIGDFICDIQNDRAVAKHSLKSSVFDYSQLMFNLQFSFLFSQDTQKFPWL